MVTKTISLLLTTLFPPYCYTCKKEGFSLCPNCLNSFQKAIDTPYPYIRSMYSFKDPSIKKIIHAIKYFHRKDLLRPLAMEIAPEIRTNKNIQYTLVPIPMPRLRKYLRGYNHAEALAYELSAITLFPVRTDILKRTALKKRQVRTRSRKERLENQRHAFRGDRAVVGMNIILIDDVTTTGATLREARETLRKQGAVHVEAFTIAH